LRSATTGDMRIDIFGVAFLLITALSVMFLWVKVLRSRLHKNPDKVEAANVWTVLLALSLPVIFYVNAPEADVESVRILLGAYFVILTGAYLIFLWLGSGTSSD